MVVHALYGDALALGLASGPACLAACGPVLVPSLLAGRAGFLPNLRTIAVFLGTRLLGYLLFARVAWELGALASMLIKPHPHLIGLVYVLMAGVLAWYAYSVRRNCAGSCSPSKLVTIGGAVRRGQKHGGPHPECHLRGAVCRAGVCASIPHQEAYAVFFPLPVWCIPISVQQDQRFRRKDRQGEVPQLRSLPECVSQHVADEGVDCQGRSVDVVYEMRRMRGCVCAAGGLVAHKRDRCWMEA
jgi:hypothetical protein